MQTLVILNALNPQVTQGVKSIGFSFRLPTSKHTHTEEKLRLRWFSLGKNRDGVELNGQTPEEEKKKQNPVNLVGHIQETGRGAP